MTARAGPGPPGRPCRLLAGRPGPVRPRWTVTQARNILRHLVVPGTTARRGASCRWEPAMTVRARRRLATHHRSPGRGRARPSRERHRQRRPTPALPPRQAAADRDDAEPLPRFQPDARAHRHDARGVRRGGGPDLRHRDLHRLPDPRRGDRGHHRHRASRPGRAAGGDPLDRPADGRRPHSPELRLPGDPPGRAGRAGTRLQRRGRVGERRHRPGAAGGARRTAAWPPPSPTASSRSRTGT